ncbi:MAG: hypothetical protein ACR2QF_10180 [Geminicoccaceae bacterium]
MPNRRWLWWWDDKPNWDEVTMDKKQLTDKAEGLLKEWNMDVDGVSRERKEEIAQRVLNRHGADGEWGGSRTKQEAYDDAIDQGYEKPLHFEDKPEYDGWPAWARRPTKDQEEDMRAEIDMVKKEMMDSRDER